MSRLWSALQPLLDPGAGPLSVDEMAAYLGRHVPGAGWTRGAVRDRVTRAARSRGAEPALLIIDRPSWIEARCWPIVNAARDEWEPVQPAEVAERLTAATRWRWTEEDVWRLIPAAERAHGCLGSCLVAP